MDKQAKKLVLSKETLRSLDDQDLSSVVGGTATVLGGAGTVVCLATVLCTALCNLANSVVCVTL